MEPPRQPGVVLAEALPLLEGLLRTISTGVVVCDIEADDQPIVYVNPTFERITGYSADEALGRNCRFLQGEDTDPLRATLMREAIARRETAAVTLLNHRADGSPFYNEVRLAPITRPNGGRPTYYLGLIADVSARVEAETSLSQANVLGSTVFNALEEGLLVLDTAGRVADANPSALRILGLTREQLSVQGWWDRLEIRHLDGAPVAPNDSPGYLAFLDDRRILGVRFLARRGDGEDRLLNFSYQPLRDDGLERPQGLVVSFRDETDRHRAEEQLRRFATLVEISDDFIAIATMDGTVQYVNEAGRKLVGLDSAEEATSAKIRDFFDEPGWHTLVDIEQAAVSADGHWQGESTLRHFKTGESIPVRVNSYLIRDLETGEPVGQATVRRDITAERRVTEDLMRSQERYEAQFRSLPLPTYVWQRRNDDFVLVEWNSAAADLATGGLGPEQGVAASQQYADAPEVLLAFERCWSRRTPVTREQNFESGDTGRSKHLIATYAHVPPDLVLVHELDITQRVEFEHRLVQMTERDDLTGLYNRRYFEQQLDAALGHSKLAVLIVDVDHFKFVNDSLGHKAGDDLLQEIAETMSGRLREGDVLARFGGDEFAVLITDCDATRARAGANHLLSAIRSSVTGVSVTASSGVSVFTDDTRVTASDAIVAADIALYEAKQRGRDRVELYSGQAGHSLTWLEQIRQAIAEQRLVIHGQRLIDLRREDPQPSYELLVRMTDEQGEIIPPGSFLPTAEQFGLIRDIDRWVTQRGIEYAATHNARVSLNLSARSLGDPEMPAWIGTLIARTGARAGDISFEFTETAAVSSVEDARSFAEQLNALGCVTALDDFGTGFGTFLLLKHVPVRALKIDLEFVRHLATSPADQRIVRSIVRIASEAELLTVAEGVEDAGTLALLREYGVDYAQGYHIAKPAPLPD
jgi:diguanylate cyclase (GGDEF)-like protein/PAS domain S-box-containing protein